MKKILLIAAVAGLASVSCRKDRTCTCTETPTTGTATTYTTKMYKVSKDDARERCIGYQTTTSFGAVSVTGDNVTCELK